LRSDEVFEQTRRRPNLLLLARGAAFLLSPYFASLIVAATKKRSGDHYLYDPVAGPWLYLARRRHDAGGKTLLVLDGLMQDMGALTMLVSLLVPEQRIRVGEAQLRVMPRLSRDYDRPKQTRGYLVGVEASGRF
jgi:hypothetical protein